MNKQELIKMLNRTIEDYTNKDGFGRGVRTGLSMATFAIKRLDEPAKPSKPVIPKIVAEQLEYWKRNKMNILWQFFLREIPSSTLSWLESDAGNYDKLIDAENNGYEVEEEKLYYTVDEKGQTILFNSQERGILRSNGIDLEIVLSEYEHAPSNIYQLTEKQIKDYDERYWPFAVEVAE